MSIINLSGGRFVAGKDSANKFATYADDTNGGYLLFNDTANTRTSLTLVGSASSGTNSPAAIFFGNTNSTDTTNLQRVASIRTLRNTNNQSADLVFETNSSGTLAEKMRISAAGAATIGPSSGANGTHTIRGDGTASFTAQVLATNASPASAQSNGLLIRAGATSADVALYVTNQASTNVLGSVNGAGSWQFSSSQASSTVSHGFFGRQGTIANQNYILTLSANNLATGDVVLRYGLDSSNGYAFQDSAINGVGGAGYRFAANTLGVGYHTASGAWTIGPASPGSALGHQIFTRAQSGTDGLFIDSNGSSVGGSLLRLGTAVTSGTQTAILFTDGVGSTQGTITCDTTANTTAYNTSSDSRLKTNPEEFSGLGVVAQMLPKQYERLCNPGTKEIGFYAQELLPVFPQAVREGGDDPETDPWSIDYGKITPVLAKAIQELKAELDAAKQRISLLEAN